MTLNKKFQIFLIINIICFLVCQGQTNIRLPYNIEVEKNLRNINTINLSKVGSEIRYIPLETNQDCLIQEIRKVIFDGTYFFISEINRLLQFNENGKFICQIGTQGRGPNEYININDFCLNTKNNEIFIISFDKILVYSFEGIFLRSMNLSFRPSQVISLNQNLLMHHLPNISGPEYFNSFSWIITDINGMIVHKIKNYLIRSSQPGLAIGESPFYLYKNNAHFMEFGVDTLYFFNDTRQQPYAVFSLGDLKMNPDPLITAGMIKNKDWQNDKLYVSTVNENNEFLFIKCFWGMNGAPLCSVYEKKTGTLTFVKDNAFKNDLGGGVSFWPEQIINDSILIDYVDAFDLLKNTVSTELRRKLTESSNPVLIIVR